MKRSWTKHDLHQPDSPVYSALDVTDEVVDPFSQSFSPFLLLERLGDRKPSAESGLKNTDGLLALWADPENSAR